MRNTVLFVCLLIFSFSFMLISQAHTQTIWAETFGWNATTWQFDENWGHNPENGGEIKFTAIPQITNFSQAAMSSNMALPAGPKILSIEQSFCDAPTDIDEILEILFIHDNTETVIWTWDTVTNDNWGPGVLEVNISDVDFDQGKVVLRASGSDNTNLESWKVLDMSIAFNFTNNCALSEFSAPAYLHQGSEGTWTATLSNIGQEATPQITVHLQDADGQSLAETTVDPIAAGSSTDVSINWVCPDDFAGNHALQLVADINDDYALDNETAFLNTTCVPAQTDEIFVGDVANFALDAGIHPTHVGRENCICQTMYYPNEIGTGGYIYGLTYYYNFAVTCPDLPFEIYVGETDAPDATGVPIPADQLHEVFNGTLTIPAGNGELFVPFDEPYFYTGRNFVTLTYRDDDEIFGNFSSAPCEFYYNIDTVLRSQLFYNYLEPALDPNNFPQGCTDFDYPHTQFLLDSSICGSISGVVRNTMNGRIENVTVTLENMNVSTKTDEQGNYSFSYLPAGTHMVTVSHPEYQNLTAQEITINAGSAGNQDFVITPRTSVMVNGRVIGNNTNQAGILGAQVVIHGTTMHGPALTDDNGTFAIDHVWADDTYQLRIIALGYQTYEEEITIQNNTLDLGDVMLSELTAPVQSLQRQISPDETSVTLSWQAPALLPCDEITENFESCDSIPDGWYSQGINTFLPTFPIAEHWIANQYSCYDYTPFEQQQVGLWWSHFHQDEWLMTPSFYCGLGAMLNFWSVVYEGSQYGDHFYVKISKDYGYTWDTLWDATELTGNGWNLYDYPYSIDLSEYNGSYVMLAFHAAEPEGYPAALPDGGLFHIWLIDNLSICSEGTTVQFDANDLVAKSTSTGTQGNRPVPSTRIQKEGAIRRIINRPASRELQEYAIYRLLACDEENPDAWTHLGDTTDLNFEDTTFGQLTPNIYRYAVQAIYSAGIMSESQFSEPCYHQMEVTISGRVTDAYSTSGLSGVTVQAGGVTTTTDNMGNYYLELLAGSYTVEYLHPNYTYHRETGEIPIGGAATLDVAIYPHESAFFDDFESYADFSISNDRWLYLDIDEAENLGIGNVTYPHRLDPFAFMTFNPWQTDPPVNTAFGMTPVSGHKVSASFQAGNAVNDNWMISPEITLGQESVLSFWAKSYADYFALDRFNVAVSTTGTSPEDFTLLNTDGPIEAPVEWNLYRFVLNQYEGQTIRFAIQAISENSFIFMVDDVNLDTHIPTSSGAIPGIPAKTAIAGNYPNPFNPSTAIQFSLNTPATVALDVYNARGQKVRQLLKDEIEAGMHSVVWDGTDTENNACASGMYFVRLKTQRTTDVRKIMLIK